jgi:hypothetical protein
MDSKSGMSGRYGCTPVRTGWMPCKAKETIHPSPSQFPSSLIIAIRRSIMDDLYICQDICFFLQTVVLHSA